MRVYQRSMSNVFLNCTPPFLRGSFIQSRIYRFSWASWSVSPRSSYLPKNWIYRYVLPCSCCFRLICMCVDLSVCLVSDPSLGVKIPLLARSPTCPVCAGIQTPVITLCSGRFMKLSSWPLSLTLPPYFQHTRCSTQAQI